MLNCSFDNDYKVQSTDPESIQPKKGGDVSYSSPPFFNFCRGEWNHTKVTIKRKRTSEAYSKFKNQAETSMQKEIRYCAQLRHKDLFYLYSYSQDKTTTMPIDLIFENSMGTLHHLMHTQKITINIIDSCKFGSQIACALSFLHKNKLVHSCVSSHAVHLIDPLRVKLSELSYITKIDIKNLPTSPKTNYFRIPEQFWRWQPGEIFIDNDCNRDYRTSSNRVLQQVSNAQMSLASGDNQKNNNNNANTLESFRTPTTNASIHSNFESLEKRHKAIDIYGLSAVIWEMLGGNEPWQDKHPDQVKEILKSKRLHVPPPLDEVTDLKIPERLCRILKHGLSRTPEKRLDTMDLYYMELQKTISHLKLIQATL